MSRSDLKLKIMKKLKEIKDPEIGYSIVDLGYITKVEVDKNKNVLVKIVLTTPLCPYGGLIFEMVEKAVRNIEGINDVKLEYDWDIAWSVERVKPEVRKKLGL